MTDMHDLVHEVSDVGVSVFANPLHLMLLSFQVFPKLH